MAKTNDDIYDILSELVTILKQQNTNSNNNGDDKKRGVRSVGNERIFTTLSKDLKEFGETVKEFQKIQKKYDRQVTNNNNPNAQYEQQINAFIKQLGKLNDAMDNGAEKFNNSREYIEEYHQTLLEQNSIQSDITTKKFNLAVLEEKLYNDKLKIEAAELKAREALAPDLEKLSKRTREAEIAFAETSEQIKKFNAEIAAIKAEFKTERKDDIKETEEIKKKNTRKQEQINITHENAMAHKEKKRLEGYNDKGQKKSNAEWKELRGDWKKYLKTTDKGRIVADGTKIAAQGAAKGVAGMASGAMNIGSMASGLSSGLSKLGPWGMVAAAIVKILKESFDMFSKVDKAASNYARSVGGGHYAQVKMRESAAALTKDMSKWGKTAYEVEDILNRMAEASEAMGRNLEGLSTNDLRSLKDLKNFGIDDQTISQFDTFGISVHNVSKQIADLYGESGKRGLNAKATIKAFTSNLKMAQNYTFARGQKALMDMAMKSAQLKFNLRDAEQFANKVSTLEGAMQAGAQLSVLGGNFAMQGNPLAMMYNGLNDVEGLQNQMLAMTKGMARWDSKKGQLDITAFDRERLKAMSQATGIDYSELTSMTFNQARVDRVSQQLGGGFKKEEEEYIKNLASLDEKGNAYIQVGGKEYSMDDIRQNKDGVRNQLKAESEAKDIKEGADMGDIWGETRDIKSIMDDYVKFFKGRFLSLLMRIGGLKDHEVAAQRLGLDLEEDKEQVKELKKAMRGKKWLRYGSSIAGGAAIGAAAGAPAGGIGAIPGAAIGAVVGGVTGAVGGAAWDSKDDTEFLMDYAKKNKIGMYAEQKKASGGFVSGDGGPTEDAIPARLSNGEFVVNAEATTRHRPLLERINRGIRNGSNLMRAESIMGLGSGELSRGSGNQKIDVSPIKIEFGTLELKIGDLSRVLDSNEVASRLLNNSAFVDNIVKEIGIRANFGYRKDDSSNKFLDSPYTRSF